MASKVTSKIRISHQRYLYTVEEVPSWSEVLSLPKNHGASVYTLAGNNGNFESASLLTEVPLMDGNDCIIQQLVNAVIHNACRTKELFMANKMVLMDHPMCWPGVNYIENVRGGCQGKSIEMDVTCKQSTIFVNPSSPLGKTFQTVFSKA